MLHISFLQSYLPALKPAIGRRPRRWPCDPSTCSSAFGSRPDRRPSWLMFQRHAHMYLIRGTNEIENSELVAFASQTGVVAVRFVIRTSRLVDNVFRRIIHSQPTFDNDICPTLSWSSLSGSYSRVLNSVWRRSRSFKVVRNPGERARCRRAQLSARLLRANQHPFADLFLSLYVPMALIASCKAGRYDVHPVPEVLLQAVGGYGDFLHVFAYESSAATRGRRA
jgi:hypothetical protein